MLDGEEDEANLVDISDSTNTIRPRQRRIRTTTEGSKSRAGICILQTTFDYVYLVLSKNPNLISQIIIVKVIRFGHDFRN